MTDDARMGAFDAVMWGIEDDPVLRSAIVTLLTLDRAPDRDLLRDRIERLTREVPQLRQRVIGNPLSLVPPRWEADPSFDLDYHVRWWAMPAGARGLGDVMALVARSAEQDFDRDRPLWELTVVTDVDDGRSRSAAILKVHHSITDGVGGMMLAATLFDLAREPVDRGPLPDAPAPHSPLDPLHRLADGISFEAHDGADWLAGLARDGTQAMRRLVEDPAGTVMSSIGFARSALRLLAPAPAPLSPILVERSLRIECALLEVPLGELRAAAHADDAPGHATVNDAFMAIVACGLGRYHEALGAPIAELRVTMPINVRPESGTVAGNAWIPSRFRLPIGGLDPRACLHAAHPAVARARTEPALPISPHVYRVLATLPRAVATVIAGTLMRGTDVAATNVPGPPFPVFLAGAEVTRIVPIAPKGGAAVNVALMSYNGTATLGFNIDAAAVTQPLLLVDCLADALDDLVARP